MSTKTPKNSAFPVLYIFIWP